MNVYISGKRRKRTREKKRPLKETEVPTQRKHKEISVDKYMQSDADNFLVPFLTKK